MGEGVSVSVWGGSVSVWGEVLVLVCGGKVLVLVCGGRC